MSTAFEDVEKVFRANVTRLRRERGMSQEELAFQADIDRTYISQIERGLANPSLGVMCRLANALGVEVVGLLKPRSAF